MAIKDILVHMDDSERCRIRLALAARIGAIHQGHLIGLNVRTRVELHHYMALKSGSRFDNIHDGHNIEAARKAKALFEGLEVADGVTKEWRNVEGAQLEMMSMHARYADLTLIGQADHSNGEKPLCDALIMAVGRPVMIVPRVGRFETVGERILVAWNASREATRAVHDAMPLLSKAKMVRVVAGEPEGGAVHGENPGADLSAHLQRHGVNVVWEHLNAEGINVGETLLNRVADEGIDMMVMGAYGHSRFREMVLGGATRHLLNHMTVPVLMSH
ncbi:universal stress protein [Magnetospirillum sp. UT-4]|uniref:universal stress protein n=1 Tax=Magnetospirillum sp. UT-4 TaxID=2681467 RepID=UPI0013811623|nr:universal stress protein [Magnetospirillum sp. UT-4]CAA7626730.1 Universal stress protein UspA and related nucleotide-binding proteins [Magnetospirillum sp. UT-4]